MILYLDTSDLFKIYVWENDSTRVDSILTTADRLASSRVAYVEMRAALAAALRGNRLTLRSVLLDELRVSVNDARFKAGAIAEGFVVV